MSLARRLNLMTLLLILPLTGLVIYLIVTVLTFTRAYEQTVSNISDIGRLDAYGGSFRDDMDYTIYRQTIGLMTYRQIHALAEEERPFGWERLIDPYARIEEARRTFEEVHAHATRTASRQTLEWILHTLSLLKGAVEKIDTVIEGRQSNQVIEQLYRLEFKVLLDDIRDKVQSYIYSEALYMNEIQDTLRTQGRQIARIALALLAVTLCAAVIISRRITRSITIPVKHLKEATERVARGDFSREEEVASTDEIAVLADSFNNMQGQIGHLIENIRTEQNQRKGLELQLLQEQINPHFLYNTLDTIVWQAESGQSGEIIHLTKALSDFFRISLSSGADWIPVSQEIKHLRAYLAIQKIRYRDILNYEIIMDENMADSYILKLLLQPLVENALYHGIKYRRGGGKITVCGHMETDCLHFSVTDTGRGMQAAQLDQVIHGLEIDADAPRGDAGTTHTGSGFGLRNVNQRICLHYQQKEGLHIESNDQGTIVSFRVPVRWKGEVE